MNEHAAGGGQISSWKPVASTCIAQPTLVDNAAPFSFPTDVDGVKVTYKVEISNHAFTLAVLNEI